MATIPYRVTATGNVGLDQGGAIHSVTLTAGGDAASVVIRESGSGGAVLLTLKAPALDTRQVRLVYSDQLHAILAGTNAEVTIEI